MVERMLFTFNYTIMASIALIILLNCTLGANIFRTIKKRKPLRGGLETV